MSWIIGDEAAGKICELTDLFFSRKLQAARERYRQDFPHYEAWMGHSGNSYSPALDFKDRSLFCFDPAAIAQFESHFLEQDSAVLEVKSDARGLILFPEFSTRYPDGPEKFRAGWDLLLGESPWIRLVARKLIVRILPIRARVRDWGSSVSSHMLPGYIFMSLMNPDMKFQNTDCAIIFAHEIGHQSLIIYQNADPILNGELTRPIYSGVRKTHRPAIMALHAAVALGFMIDTAQKLLSSSQDAAEQKYIEGSLRNYSKQLRLSLSDMKNLDPTAVGKRIIEDLGAIAES